MSKQLSVALNPDLKITRQGIGDGKFCIVIDDFLANPEKLIEYANNNTQKFYATPRGYPGIMMNLDDDMLMDFHRFIRNRMSRQFRFLRGGLKIKTGLSMVTLPAEKLSNFQRLCHTDPRTRPGCRNYAALLYLYSNEQLGGTAFYRWKHPQIIKKALAMELQDPAAAGTFLAEYCAAFRQTPRYMSASNELAELVEVIEARFNRLIFYSGEVPHSGHITAPQLLSGDPRKGRLTLNSFVTALPG